MKTFFIILIFILGINSSYFWWDEYQKWDIYIWVLSLFIFLSFFILKLLMKKKNKILQNQFI
jgi:hypothetical protein